MRHGATQYKVLVAVAVQFCQSFRFNLFRFKEAAGDPFRALFAQRTPGLAAPRRVASKKGRKIATEVRSLGPFRDVLTCFDDLQGS